MKKLFFCSMNDEDEPSNVDIFKDLDDGKKINKNSSLILSDTTIFKRYKLKIFSVSLQTSQETEFKFNLEKQEKTMKLKNYMEFDNFEL
jgi:hypothetical protein